MGGHYTPKLKYRSSDASRYAHDLYAALSPWLAAAAAGTKRHPIRSEANPEVERAADSLLCNCAAVLAECPDWEGALLAHHFAQRGWPVDCELVRLCHTWSVSLLDRIMARVRAQG